MKKIFLSLVLLVSIVDINSMVKKDNHTRKVTNKYFKLTSRYLVNLDGVTRFLDGGAIGEVIQVRKMIDDLRKDGTISKKKDASGHIKVDRIIFNNRPCSISCLVTNEAQAKDEASKLALKACLKQAKKGFIDLTKPFINRIEPAKRLVVEIIKESCNLRNIPHNDTVLLDWASTKSGSEEAVFSERIKNFVDFDKFLHHVYNFLGDLIRSCEIGFKQYKENNKK